MSELPLSGEVKAVHETVIEVSEYASMVGALMVLGTRLILAPVDVAEE